MRPFLVIIVVSDVEHDSCVYIQVSTRSNTPATEQVLKKWFKAAEEGRVHELSNIYQQYSFDVDIKDKVCISEAFLYLLLNLYESLMIIVHSMVDGQLFTMQPERDMFKL